MTRALALALVASGAAAAGLVELAVAMRATRGRPLRSLRLAPGPAALARIGRAVGGLRAPDALGRRLELAGIGPRVGPADLMAAKLGAAVVAMAAAPLAAAALPGRLRLVLLVGAPVAGFLAPDALLARRVRRRARVMAAELADVLDLLHAAVGAGMSPLRALGEVGRRRGGLLAGELAAAATRLELGAPRAVALDGLRRRCPLDAVGALLAALERAERHGAALAPALAALAADARAEQARRLREQAARAGPQIQLVIALLLVPAVLLLLAAALLTGLG